MQVGSRYMCVCMGMYGSMDLWMYACMNTDAETAKTLWQYGCMKVCMCGCM